MRKKSKSVGDLSEVPLIMTEVRIKVWFSQMSFSFLKKTCISNMYPECRGFCFGGHRRGTKPPLVRYPVGTGDGVQGKGCALHLGKNRSLDAFSDQFLILLYHFKSRRAV